MNNNKEIILLKLGGSLLTDKNKPFSIREDVVKKAVQQVIDANIKLIIINTDIDISKKPDGSYRSSLNESKGRFQMAAFLNNNSELDTRLKGIFVDAFLFFDPYSEGLLPFVFTTYFASANSIWQYGFPDWALTSPANASFDVYNWFYDADPVHNPGKEHIWT